MEKKEIRVGAIQSANESEVNLFGYGVYVGDLEIPDAHEKFEAFWKNCSEDLLKDNISKEEALQIFMRSPFVKNPCIKLDNGETVWGYQCWWGPEDKVKASIGDRKVNMVSLPQETETVN